MPKKTPTVKAMPVGHVRDEAVEQAAKISAEYKKKEPGVKKGEVAPASTLRERILSLSLFPNLYNKKMVMRYGTD